MTPPTVYPTLRYQDAPGAIRFLTGALGFTEHFVVRGDGDTIAHAQLAHGAGMVMLGSVTDGSDGRPVFDTGPNWTYVVVEDPDSHHDAALAAGAEIVVPLADQDYGSRDYTARDPEGNLWTFGTYQPSAGGG